MYTYLFRYPKIVTQNSICKNSLVVDADQFKKLALSIHTLLYLDPCGERIFWILFSTLMFPFHFEKIPSLPPSLPPHDKRKHLEIEGDRVTACAQM